MKKIAIIFATASILGFVMESLFVFVLVGQFPDSGNNGYYYQLYGFCALALYFFYTKFKFKPLRFFIFGVFMAMGIEFLASMFLDYALNITAWSYCDEPTNIFCRTTLFRGILLSIAATAYVVYIAPFFIKFIEDKFFVYVCYVISVYILLDTVFQAIYTLATTL